MDALYRFEPYHIARFDAEEPGAVAAVCHTLVVSALSAITGEAVEEIVVSTPFRPPPLGAATNFHASGMWLATVDRCRTPMRLVQPARGTGVN
jgi:hypothetical protein